MMAGQEDGLAASFLLKKKRSRLHRAVVVQPVKRFVRQKNRGIFHDNAIEGGMRLPASSSSGCVRLAFSKVWDMLFISCVNDADEKQIKRSKEGFMSTKEHPEVHGFGTKSMKKIVSDAGGTIDFKMEQGKFSVEIMLGGETSCS